MNLHSFAVLGLFVALLACQGQKSTSSAQQPKDSVRAFVWPEIPAIITTPEQKVAYVLDNYWQNFDFADTAYVHHPEITEQAWVDYLSILPQVPVERAQKLLQQTFERASADKKVYIYFTDLADKYLYDPNSPFRNEDYYIAVLRQMIESPLLNKYEKERPNDRLRIALLNRVGTPATDFGYTLANGRKGTLYEIKSPYTLIFFNNPGCHACLETINALKRSIPILQSVLNKKLTILAVYPDNDLHEWESHQKDIPAEWINAYNQTLQETTIYDLKAIPCLYLLDANKRVLLKDTGVQAVEALISR
ncbi:MAG: DUF5106 domain-containing protein [Prevotellaceae bacterium]|jgi:hypothetical protein|nr:DUF5106 domain-containing protein [Prevotellaceae bacterium]